jgi:hypothetical protein
MARAVEPRDNAAGDRIGHGRKDDRHRSRLPLEGSGRQGPACQDDVGLQADQLLCERWYPIDVIAVPSKVDARVAAIGPTQARKRLRERRDGSLRYGIVFIERHGTPMRRTRSPCCARAASGQAAAGLYWIVLYAIAGSEKQDKPAFSVLGAIVAYCRRSI